MHKESVVEKYLHDQVTSLGGTTRKWVSPNYVGVPDRIIIVETTVEKLIEYLKTLPSGGVIAIPEFTEVKTEIGKLSKMQNREIKRLQKHGAIVTVVYGKAGVNDYIEQLKQRMNHE